MLGESVTRGAHVGPRAHSSPAWPAAPWLWLQQLLPVSLWQARGSRVAETRNVILPFSKQLWLFLLIADFLSPFLKFPYQLYFCSVCLPLTPSIFLSAFLLLLSPLPLQENQRMQQKIDTMTKEVFDLQETLLWKDKNIRV